MEVGTPVIFGICIIILVFLPLMTLEGMEGKMFAPLAYTIAIALGISLVLSLTLSPVLSVLPAEGRPRARYVLPSHAEKAVWQHAGLGDYIEKKSIAARSRFFRRPPFRCSRFSGTSFIPELKEGTISPEHGPGPEYLARRVHRDGDGGDPAA